MKPSRIRPIVAALAATVVGFLLTANRPAAFQRTAEPTLSQLLAAAGQYVAAYELSFGAVVAEEWYRQSISGPASGLLISRRATTGDVLLFNSSADSGGAGWMSFRDVQTLDTKPFPSKPGRLGALAANPTRDALAEAMRVNAISDSLTIGAFPRRPAIPTAALAYLRRTRQPLAEFEFDGMKTVGNVQAAVLKFTERPRARMTDADDFSTSGRFWIDPANGRVVQTELSITSVIFTGKVEVQYASQRAMDAWMPVRMFEQYTAALPLQGPSGRISAGATSAYVDGLATYQGFRRFELKPELIIK